jgi:hypothetical protein
MCGIIHMRNCMDESSAGKKFPWGNFPLEGIFPGKILHRKIPI